ncbi:MAG: hypothetical protein OK449_10505, partial [Thaumarchaeota archaeon]|nr:hypothetical protein [Nitrososphaerota archaeon]
NNAYHYFGSVETSCDDTTCNEEGFWATASSTGTDTLVFAAGGRAFLGGDLYDVAGINASTFRNAFGGSFVDNEPSLLPPLTAYANGFVAAAVIANSADQFSAYQGYTLIPGQPCYSCGMVGGWQASEYEAWGASAVTDGIFGYPQTNDGWAELAVSFAPNVATTSVSCTPSPVTVTTASTCTATVAAASPTGTITWKTNGTGTFSPPSCALSSSSCSVSYTPSVPSSVLITANYGGDTNNPESSGNYSLSVAKGITTTTVTCSPSPITTGSPTTCSTSVSGVSPSGTVTWASSGVANFSPATTCTLSAGSCAVNYTPSSATSPVTITAVYSGDGDNDGSMGTFMLSVAQVTTTSTTSSTTTSTTSSSSTTTSTSTTSSSSVISSTTTSTKPSTTSSSTTPTLASTSSASSTTTTSKATTSTSTSAEGSTAIAQTSTSSSSGGGVPVFPYQFAIASVFTALLAASYLVIRRKKLAQIN